MSSDSNRYTIELTSQASKELSKLEEQIQTRVRLAIDILASNPRPHRAIKLKGSDSYRVRVGSYRILYKIFDSRLVVVVIRIEHRSRVYGG